MSAADTPIAFTPIGVFSCEQQYPQQAPRQGVLNTDKSRGHIELHAGANLDQALHDLDGFDKIWLIYVFDRNPNWKPLISPPRGGNKRGVFASRAPYRPNPIGMSCVSLVSVQGRHLVVEDFDLLDGTPILDIKPYLAYADSFPDASTGWTRDMALASYSLAYSEQAVAKIHWISQHAAYDIAAFITSQLSESPLDARRKRITAESKPNSYVIAARTWRIHYCVAEDALALHITDLSSGYSTAELSATGDKYGDKHAHREYIAKF
jgi:tRNA (adenine37-N6)-methyltransferase